MTSRQMVNLSTKLPDYNAFTKKINKRISSKESFAVLYVDIDNLRTYNILYGFDKGDKIIELTAGIIQDSIRNLGEKEDFAAHLGRDDFAVITDPGRVDPISSQIIKRFDHESLNLYKEEDRQRGYLFSLDRKGGKVESPLMTLSIGVVTNIKRKIQHLAEINQIGDELINYAKGFFGSNYVVDKRYKEEEQILPDEIIERERVKRILIIDDDPDLSQILSDVLSEDNTYKMTIAKTGKAALKELEKDSFNLALIDIRLPDMDGLEILSAIKQKDPLIEGIIMTGYATINGAIEAMRHEAYDFLVKPIDMERIKIIIARGLEHQRLALRNRELIRSLTKQTTELNKKMEEILNLNRGLQALYVGTIATLAATIDAKDHYTQGHSERVREYAVATAKELKLSKREVEMIQYACQLHDLGKIGIKDYILSKDGPLTDRERWEIKMHPGKGAEMLRPLDFLKEILPIIEHHHERYDGKGYPTGLNMETIPLGARILAVADSFDAMTSERPYRPAMKIEEAVDELKGCSGSQFDPQAVKAFLKVMKKKKMVHEGDGE